MPPVEDKVSKSIKDSSDASLFITVAGLVAAGGLALLSLSSPVALWAIMNQMQLWLLLVIIKCGIPEEVVYFIVRSKFFSLSADFLNIEKGTHSYVISNWFDVDQDHDELSKIGCKSGSTFANTFSIMTSILTMVGLHLLF